VEVEATGRGSGEAGGEVNGGGGGGGGSGEAGGGVNGGGGGGGGVESEDGGGLGSDGFGGSFIGKLESGDFDLVRPSGARQEAPCDRERREERPRGDRRGAQFRTRNKPGFPATSPQHQSL